MILYKCISDTIGGKYMKKPFMLITLMCVVLLTGCSSLAKLSEDDSNILTEYMAGAVLKHSDDYTGGLLTMEEIEDIEAKEEARNKKMEDNNKGIQVSTITTSSTKNENTTSSTKNQNTSSSSSKVVSLTKAVGNKNFKINYNKYELYDKYVSEDSTSKMTLEAGKNKKLLVLYFGVKNLSNETLKIDLVEEGIDYQVSLNNGNKLEPLLTLLMNDIQYLNLDIAANKTREAVIVFEVDKNVDLSNSVLTVTREEMTSSNKLK